MSASKHASLREAAPVRGKALGGGAASNDQQSPTLLGYLAKASRARKPVLHEDAVRKLAALAQDTRLAAFRLMIVSGEQGCSAGFLADSLGIPATTLSFHLAALVHADLVSQHRLGRQIIYAPVLDSVNGLITYMLENCCSAGPCGASGAEEAPSASAKVRCVPKARLAPVRTPRAKRPPG